MTPHIEIAMVEYSRGDTAEEVLESIIADYSTRDFDSAGRFNPGTNSRTAQELADVVLAELRRLEEWNGKTIYVLIDWATLRLEVTNDAALFEHLYIHGWRLAGWAPRERWER